MTNGTLSRQKRGFITSLFGLSESQDVKRFKMKAATITANQNLQQLFIETNVQINNITCIDLAKKTT